MVRVRRGLRLRRDDHETGADADGFAGHRPALGPAPDTAADLPVPEGTDGRLDGALNGRRGTPLPAARRAVERALAAQRRTADGPEHRRPEPTPPQRPVRLFRRTLSKAWNDRVLGLSAEAAFWQLLSLPPLFLALLGSLGYFSGTFGAETVQDVERHLLDAFARAFSPTVVSEVIQPMVNSVLHRGRADVISIGTLLALWAGSSATSTFVNTVTIAYGMRDLRGAVRSRLLALWIYLGTVVIGVALLPLLVLGPSLLVDVLPDAFAEDVSRLVSAAYWPAVGGILLAGLTTFYHLAPPRRLPWHRGVPGAVLAMCVFLLGSGALRAYINFVLRQGYTYGTLAAPIAALLFLFVLALAVLLGAELNATIEQTWPSRPSRRARRKARRLRAREQAAREAALERAGD